VANEEALQGYFTHRMGEYLRAHDRRLVGWDEILEGGVPADATVMSWRGVQGAIAAAAAGHDAVLSPDPTLYLDSRQGRSPSEPPGRGTVETLADVYHFDPLPGPLAADGRHVLGLQANLWTEHVRTEERAAYMTWPRAAALAEIGWSPPARLDWPDFLARLPAEFRRLRDRKSTRLNSSHVAISYAVFCLKKKKLARERLSPPDEAGLRRHVVG